MAEKKKSIMANVVQILKEYPEARGDDKILLTYYWYLIDGVKFDGIQEFAKTFKNATPESSITRLRRKIQFDKSYTGDRYLPEGEVSELRHLYAERFKEKTTDL